MFDLIVEPIEVSCSTCIQSQVCGSSGIWMRWMPSSFVYVAFLSWGSPSMCTHTHTCTGRGVRGLRVRLFSITPPCWQPHSISPSSEDFISLSGEEGLLCQELTMAEDIPTQDILTTSAITPQSSPSVSTVVRTIFFDVDVLHQAVKIKKKNEHLPSPMSTSGWTPSGWKPPCGMSCSVH